MRYMFMLILGTAMLVLASGSARGITTQVPLMLDSFAVVVPANDAPPPPPPRSKSCPPKTNDNTPNGNCGKGGDSNLP